MRSEYELADHLMTLYWWGKIGLEEDSLLAKFYAKADDKLCACASQWLGRNLWRLNTPVPEDMLLRLMALWAHRIAEARCSESSHREELSQFGWRFASGKFDDSWAIEQLIAVLHINGKIVSEHLVAERLVSLCPRMPYQVVLCFDTLVVCDREGWTARRCRDGIALVLKQTVGTDDPKLKKARNNLLNRMAALGCQLQ